MHLICHSHHLHDCHVIKLLEYVFPRHCVQLGRWPLVLQQHGQKDMLAQSQGGCIAHAHCPRQLPEVFVVNH